MSSTTPSTKEQKPSFIARKFLSMNEEQAKIMPPDSWIIRTAWETTGEIKAMRRTLGVIGACAAGTVLLGAAAVALPFMSVPLLTAAAGSIATVGASLLAGAAAVGLGFLAKSKVGSIKEKFFPDLKKIIGTKFLKYKGDQMMDAFRANLAKNKKRKASVKAVEPATPARQPERLAAEIEQKVETGTQSKPEIQKKKSRGWAGGLLRGAFCGKKDDEAANDSAPEAAEKAANGKKPDGPAV